MPADPISAAERAPRRARYLIPRELPHRAEAIAALAVLALLAHLLFAQVTLAAAVAFHVVSKVSRWRPQWLLVPAAAGLIWLLAIGPAAALAGFTAAPRAVAGALAALAADPARLAAVAAALPRWLPGQLPVALTAAAAEAAVAWWAGWLHTDEWDLPPARPGLAAAARQRVNGAQVRAGGVVTRDGFSLGVDRRSGRQAAVSWREAEGGMLVTGASWAGVAAAGAQAVHAAVRRRKPVIAVDLAGDPALAAALSAACTAAGVPLQVFGGVPAGAGGGQAAVPGYYEPLRSGSPARKASLIAGMIDWAGRPEAARRDCTAVLTDIFAVAAAAPAGPGTAVLDDVTGLLDPAALAARLERVPPYHPRRAALAGRVRASATRLGSDPESAAVVAGQLAALRAAPLGRWLEAGPPAGRPGSQITLAGVVRDRGVALFRLGLAGQGQAAEMIAALVALDLAGLCADLHRAGIPADGVAWFGRCEAANPAALGALLAAGSRAGLASVLGTTSAQLSAWLAGQVRVLAAHRLADPGLAGLIAPMTGTRLARVAGVPGLAGTVAAPAVPAAALAVPPLAVPPLAVPGAAVPGIAGAAVPGTSMAGAAVSGVAVPGTAGAGAAGAGAAGAAVPGIAMAAGGPGPARPGAAAGLAGLRAGAAIPLGVERCPVVPAAALCALAEDEFTLIVGGPGGRVVPLARAVQARIPEARPVRPTRLVRLSAAAAAGTGGTAGAVGTASAVGAAGAAGTGATVAGPGGVGAVEAAGTAGAGAGAAGTGAAGTGTGGAGTGGAGTVAGTGGAGTVAGTGRGTDRAGAGEAWHGDRS